MAQKKLIKIRSTTGNNSVKAEECHCEWWRKASQCVVLNEKMHCLGSLFSDLTYFLRRREQKARIAQMIMMIIDDNHCHRRQLRNSNDVVHIDVDEDSVKEEEKEGHSEHELDHVDADTDDYVDDHIGAESNEDEANIRSTHAPHYDMLTSSQNDAMSQKQAHIHTTTSKTGDGKDGM